jgi:tetratricopeptide (TPR) repeat protein
MAITLPVILFIVDYFLNRKPDKRMFLEKIPFFLLSLIFGIVAIIAKYLSGSIRSESFLTLTDKVVVAVFGAVFYIKKILLPVKFSCIYPYYGVKDIPSSLYILAGFTIFLIAVIISSRYTRKIVFGVAFFLASILPVLQFIPINSTLVADRYAYIPSIGIFYIIALGFVWLYTKMKNVSLAKYFLLTLSIIIVFTLAGLTWKRCRVWKDSLALWSDALVSYPNLAEAYNNRGVTYYGQGDLERAISDYSKAIEMNPNDVVAYYNRASAYCDYKKPDQAIDDYDRILEINPDFADTSQKRTYLLRKKGM